MSLVKYFKSNGYDKQMILIIFAVLNGIFLCIEHNGEIAKPVNDGYALI